MTWRVEFKHLGEETFRGDEIWFHHLYGATRYAQAMAWNTTTIIEWRILDSAGNVVDSAPKLS